MVTTKSNRVDMQSATNTPMGTSALNSASSGRGGLVSKSHGRSFVGVPADGLRVESGVRPAPRRNLFPNHSDIELAASEIRSILNKLPPLPASVSHWIVQPGIDSADEPAVWIWAVLSDKKVDIDSNIAIRDLISDFIECHSEVPIRVYVSFKTTDETENSS